MADCPVTKAYGSTATYMGGIGGQAITEDICDACWGSGNSEDPGPNLRVLVGRAREDEDIAYLLREVSILRDLLQAAAEQIEISEGKPWVEMWWAEPDEWRRPVMQRAGLKVEKDKRLD